MAEEIGADGVRVRFSFDRLGSPRRPSERAHTHELAQLVAQLGDSGLCPILNDGKLGGNAACRVGAGASAGLWLTPSGRMPGAALRADELVEVVDFDVQSWSASGFASPGVNPTSDTPLHWAALMRSEGAQFALHGHALDDEKSAAALSIPISANETLFSTPADREALLALMARYPYPGHKIWSRRGHGFFLLADEYSSASASLHELSERLQKDTAPV